jgi:hypothetical protein
VSGARRPWRARQLGAPGLYLRWRVAWLGGKEEGPLALLCVRWIEAKSSFCGEFHRRRGVGGGVAFTLDRNREGESKRERERKQEENVGLAFSTSRTRGNANTTPVRSLHTSRLLWRGRHVPKLDVSRTREPTETIPFLGLYLSDRKVKQQNNCTTIQCYKSTTKLLKRSQAKTNWFANYKLPNIGT